MGRMLWIFFIIATAVLASQKNRSILGWTVLGLFFGPFAFLVLAVFPNLEKIHKGETVSEEIDWDFQEKDDTSSQKKSTLNLNREIVICVRCPHCKGLVEQDVKKCRFCGANL